MRTKFVDKFFGRFYSLPWGEFWKKNKDPGFPITWSTLEKSDIALCTLPSFFIFLMRKQHCVDPTKMLTQCWLWDCFERTLGQATYCQEKSKVTLFFSDKSTKCCFQDCEATFLKWRDDSNVELQNGASNLLPKKEHRLRNGEISSFCEIRNADEFEKPPVRTS